MKKNTKRAAAFGSAAMALVLVLYVAHCSTSRLDEAQARLIQYEARIDSLHGRLEAREDSLDVLRREREHFNRYLAQLDSMSRVQAEITQEAKANVLFYSQSDDSLVADLNRILVSLHSPADSAAR